MSSSISDILNAFFATVGIYTQTFNPDLGTCQECGYITTTTTTATNNPQ